MVISVINGVTTYYASSSYVMEVDGSDTTVRKTYSAGSTSLAVRTIVNGSTETLNWLLSDHLGSSSITTTADGTWNSEIRYSAFGETRYSSGITPTDYRYTGQLEQADVNLYYYNARYYDAALGRFIQADTIIPGAGDSKSYDRYVYVNNNPLKYTDPSGHCIASDGSIKSGYPFGTSGLCSGFSSMPDVTQPAEINVFPGIDDDLDHRGLTTSKQIPIVSEKEITEMFALNWNEEVYPGRDAGGKQGQAENQLIEDVDSGNTAPKILFCYSAGNEACVMYAERTLEAGIPVLGIVFIGGSFYASENNVIYTSEAWKNRIDTLRADYGVSIYMINDAQSEHLYGEKNVYRDEWGPIFKVETLHREDGNISDHGSYTFESQRLGPTVQQNIFDFTQNVLNIWY
ncbi:MAG: RHS repeat-associated core domain-containing protein [Anaerolineaceae bacterium]|nr:RHS repeat-associated core domain-containing protein [Anaerolineaceae bacterium]